MSDALRIVTGGRRYEGWRAHSVSRSLELGASVIELDVATWPADVDRILLEDEIRADIVDSETGASTRVFTGHMESLDEDEGPDNLTSQISGRSLTSTIVDSSAPLGTHQGLTLLELARRLSEPFGVSVVTDIEPGDPIPSHRVQPGETVFETLERVARRRGVLLSDTPAGELLLTAGATGRAAAAIVVGENAKLVRRRVSVADRFSTYRVRGQHATSEDVVVPVSWEASDPGVRRSRRALTLSGESEVKGLSAQTRVLVEAARRIGQAVRHTYSVVGWRRWDGELWAPNQIVQVTDARIGYHALEFLIAEVVYELGDEGTTTAITVVPPVAFARPSESIVLPAGLEGVWGARQPRARLPRSVR